MFHNKGAADGFAGTLDDNRVEAYSRKVLEKEIPAGVEQENTDDNESFLTLDIEKAEYPELKHFVKFYGLLS